MEIYEEIRQLCNSYLEKVFKDSKHELTPPERLKLYQLFGPSNQTTESAFRFLNNGIDETEFVRTKADQMLGWLSVLTVEKVLPIWEQNFEYKLDEELYYPVEMLELSKRVLLKTINEKLVFNGLSGEFYDAQVDSLCNEKVYCVYAASYAGLEVVLEGIEGLRYHPAYTTDETITYSSRDFAAFAARAYCSNDLNEAGLWKISKEKVLPLKFDLQKRLEFWQWWLIEAIPQAWELANQSTSQ